MGWASKWVPLKGKTNVCLIFFFKYTLWFWVFNYSYRTWGEETNYSCSGHHLISVRFCFKYIEKHNFDCKPKEVFTYYILWHSNNHTINIDESYIVPKANLDFNSINVKTRSSALMKSSSLFEFGTLNTSIWLSTFVPSRIKCELGVPENNNDWIIIRVNCNILLTYGIIKNDSCVYLFVSFFLFCYAYFVFYLHYYFYFF